MAENEQQQNMPDLPEGPKTTAEMGMSIFDLAHDPKLRPLNNLLTRTDMPAMVRSIYLNVINSALVLKETFPKYARLLLDRAATDLMLRVSEKGKRVHELLTPIELELHRDSRKQEEKPKV